MESDNENDLRVFHITHEVSLSLSGGDCLTALKVSQKEKEKEMFEKLLRTSSFDGGKTIRIPLSHGIDTEV